MTSPQSRQPGQSIDSTTTKATQVFDQLERAVGDLKTQLQQANQPDVVGRDTAEIRALFNIVYDCERRLAQLMDISWTPSWSGE